MLPTVFSANLFASKPIDLGKDVDEHPVNISYVDVLVDSSKNLTINQVKKPSFKEQFRQSRTKNSKNENVNAAYWLHAEIYVDESNDKNYLIEYYDPYIEDIEVYVVDNASGKVLKTYFGGNKLPFSKKSINHKNFGFFLPEIPEEGLSVYTRIVSDDIVFLFGIVRSYKRFSFYSLNEYFYLGAYYGFILAMALYNFFLFLKLKQKVYLYYVGFILSNGIFTSTIDGMGFQYLWPNLPYLNQVMGVISTFFIGCFLLLYVSLFFSIKTNSFFLYRLIQIVISVRFVILIVWLLFFHRVNSSGVFDIIPILLAYYIGIHYYKKGEREARYFVIGFTVFIIGFVVTNLAVDSIFGLTITPNILTVYSLNYGLILELLFFSLALADQAKILHYERLQAQDAVIRELREKEELKDKVNKELEEAVQARTGELETKKEELQQLYKEVTDNIKTAESLQDAMLPSTSEMDKILKEYFILYKPKDIVSGDFYWQWKFGSRIFLAAVDCTGHGVAGAFMSLVGYNLLNKIVQKKPQCSADEVLNKLSSELIEFLHQREAESDTTEGMDLSLIIYDPENHSIEFAGALNPIYIVREGELLEYKGDRFSIGILPKNKELSFSSTTIQLEDEDTVYMFSDGYADQIGGPTGFKKFLAKRFKEKLLKISALNMARQKEELEKTYEEWRGEVEQMDDILVMGLKFRKSI